jgi:hypothetical protein
MRQTHGGRAHGMRICGRMGGGEMTSLCTLALIFISAEALVTLAVVVWLVLARQWMREVGE